MSEVYLPEAGTVLIDRFLYYVDWEGSASAPFHVDIATKREGHPHHYVFRMVEDPGSVRTPLCLVSPEEWPEVGETMGQQRVLRFRCNIFYVIAIDPYDIPARKIREGITKIVENVMASNRLGLDWVANLEHTGISFSPDFEQVLRFNMIPFSCAMASFVVETYEDLGHKP
ncbi:MAG: hypothetical protein DRO99_01625 [Candidatus Aenigmatarchaeota archaeon]|nr:MAG: hypothetical protein DRO99_01625 [Candidatus Aenigmarchaeota archaeon]